MPRVVGGLDERGATAMSDAKEAVRLELDARFEDLVVLSHRIHAHPEVAFEETHAAAWAGDALDAAGFTVSTGVAGLPTAFSATSGSGPFVVGLCAEYDALPGIGHACGHNIIAAAAVGAATALAAVADEAGLTVRVLGTPAEEGGGGKVTMLDAGAFDDVHAAMMVHPWPEDWLEAACLAVSHFDVRFRGRGAHASAAPWEGVNAADAMVVAQVGIGLLRQQLPPGDQVHGIVTDGGAAANVVPANAAGRFMCRSRTLDGLGALEPRVRACFEAGALATGAEVSFDPLCPTYSHMESDPDLLELFRANAEALGRSFAADERGDPAPTLSTDMANVSLALPSIHPLLAIETRGAVNHQPEFAAACVTESADRAIRDGALAMAWTALDAAERPSLRERLVAGR